MSFGQSPKDAGGVPLGTGAIPDGTGTLYLLKQANKSTDAAGNIASLCFVADATTVLNQASAAKTISGTTGDLNVGAFKELLLGFNITTASGTSPTLQFSMDIKGPDGVYYPAWTGSQYTTQPQKVLVPIGPGLTVNTAFGSTVRFNWTIGGTTPSWTFSLWIQGK